MSRSQPMLSLMRHGARLFLASLLLLCSTGAAAVIIQEFDVAPGGSLVVEADGAKFKVRGGNGRQVRISINRGGDSAVAILEDYGVHFNHQRGEVALKFKRRHWIDDWVSAKSVVITIDVPSRFNIDLKSSEGKIDVADLMGTIRVSTSGGKLHFENVDGSIYGRTTGGSIQLDGTSRNADLGTTGGWIQIGTVDGSIQARTSSGDISIGRAGRSVYAETSGGAIQIGEAHGPIEAKTTEGNINARIASQPARGSTFITSGGSVIVQVHRSFAIDLNARGGEVRTDIPMLKKGDYSSNKIEGRINGGGPELYLRTSGGSVRLQEWTRSSG